MWWWLGACVVLEVFIVGIEEEQGPPAVVEIMVVFRTVLTVHEFPRLSSAGGEVLIVVIIILL